MKKNLFGLIATAVITVLALTFSGCEKIEINDEFNLPTPENNESATDKALNNESIQQNTATTDVAQFNTKVMARLASEGRLMNNISKVAYYDGKILKITQSNNDLSYALIDINDESAASIVSLFKDQMRDIVDRITTSDYNELAEWARRQAEAGNIVYIMYDRNSGVYTGIADNGL